MLESARAYLVVSLHEEVQRFVSVAFLQEVLLLLFVLLLSLHLFLRYLLPPSPLPRLLLSRLLALPPQPLHLLLLLFPVRALLPFQQSHLLAIVRSAEHLQLSLAALLFAALAELRPAKSDLLGLHRGVGGHPESGPTCPSLVYFVER